MAEDEVYVTSVIQVWGSPGTLTEVQEDADGLNLVSIKRREDKHNIGEFIMTREEAKHLARAIHKFLSDTEANVRKSAGGKGDGE